MKKAVIGALILFATSGVSAQPASFSSETGILDIPALTIDGRAAFTDVELSLTDRDSGDFKLVDFKQTDAGSSGIQELVLQFGETKPFNDNTTIQFSNVLSESRCPMDVLCITAGEVTVLVKFVETLPDANKEETILGLTLQGLNISEPEYQGTWFRLAQASPYPVTTEEFVEENYEIRIEYSSVPFK